MVRLQQIVAQWSTQALVLVLGPGLGCGTGYSADCCLKARWYPRLGRLAAVQEAQVE